MGEGQWAWGSRQELGHFKALWARVREVIEVFLAGGGVRGDMRARERWSNSTEDGSMHLSRKR